jgi:Big-like domain-containing protein
MKRLIPLLCLVALACGGGGSSPSPTTPTPTPPPAPPVPPANRSPSITALTFTPGFGIATLTRFDYSASASDPDGDALTFTWDIAGTPASGPSGSITFAPPGVSGTARVTVSDGKGGTATDTRTFVVGSGSGTWRGTWGGWVFTSNLTQNGTALTGDYSDQLGPGRLDPAVANTIDANGNVKLRYKQSIFSDFTFTGRISSTGRTITGVVNGSGAVNVPFTMTK